MWNYQDIFLFSCIFDDHIILKFWVFPKDFAACVHVTDDAIAKLDVTLSLVKYCFKSL